MNLFEMTRALIDIESITENEEQVGEFLFKQLSILASRFGGGSYQWTPKLLVDFVNTRFADRVA